MSQRIIAEIYADKTVYHIDKAFDYLVPPHLIETIQRGCRVIIPFGTANKKVQGLVASVRAESGGETPRLKPIVAQLDETPMVTEEMFSIIEFLVRNTFCTYYDAVKAILPTGISVDIIQSYELVKGIADFDASLFSKEEQNLITFLKTAKTEKEMASFLECKGNPNKKTVVKSLLDKGIIQKTDILKTKVPQKKIRMVKIADGFEPENTKLSPKQKEVISLLTEVRTAMLKELCYLCGVTEAVVRNLAKKHIVEFFNHTEEKQYLPIALEKVTLDDIQLSSQQQQAYEGILSLIHEDKPNAVLLYGITGSGKTQVYIKLIEQVLNEGKTAVMLVPEISLTPQMVQKFKSLFGNIVAVIHSNLSLAERLDEFRRIQSKQAHIVIGTRSAVFAPLENIGVIILDEEGEGSYKSEASPRYHAREVAKFRCVNHKATLVLGSATPSIESYYYAEIGRYHRFILDTRYQNATLPQVYLVDMLQEQREGNFSPISDILGEQLSLNLQQGEQSILLINRRGYHSFATCMECGEVITCPSCDVAMTYHKINGCLMCHYCGHTQRFVSTCPSCKGAYIKLTGSGTQRLEDELQLLLPKARILRMDTDTTYSRDSYEKNFAAFGRGEYDIMVGTQMIAKGLDFPNVTLVGVFNADSGLFSADFKSSERIFSLITQVIGRSGRSQKSGRAYIQTMNVENSVINLAAEQNYNDFYAEEIQMRKEHMSPPFCDICMIGFSGTNEQGVLMAARRAMEILYEQSKQEEDIAIKVLGVSPANIYKISNKYRYRILIKCKCNQRFKSFLSRVLKLCPKDKLFRGITIYADINGDISG